MNEQAQKNPKPGIPGSRFPSLREAARHYIAKLKARERERGVRARLGHVELWNSAEQKWQRAPVSAQNFFRYGEHCGRRERPKPQTSEKDAKR